jgi:hypothetical protein
MGSRKFGFHSGSVHVREVKIDDGSGVSIPKVFSGSGAPSITAPLGSLYINLTGSTATTRLYINTDGGTTWAYFTVSA